MAQNTHRAMLDATEALIDYCVSLRGRGKFFKTGDSEGDAFLASSRSDMLARTRAALSVNDFKPAGWLATILTSTASTASKTPAPQNRQPVKMRNAGTPARSAKRQKITSAALWQLHLNKRPGNSKIDRAPLPSPGRI